LAKISPDVAFLMKNETGKFTRLFLEFRPGAYRSCTLFVVSVFVWSCSGAQVPLQTGLASRGGAVTMSQTNIQNNYFDVVKREGTATTLISEASNINELQNLLGQINREASAALGLWENQLRAFYQRSSSEHSVTIRVSEAIKLTRQELREIQKQAADALTKSDLSRLKSSLFLLDGVASELAGKVGKTRPLSN